MFDLLWIQLYVQHCNQITLVFLKFVECTILKCDVFKSFTRNVFFDLVPLINDCRAGLLIILRYEILISKFRTFFSDVTTVKSLELFSRNLRKDFFLVLRHKVYKKVPNILRRIYLHSCPAQRPVYQASTLLIGCLNFLRRL